MYKEVLITLQPQGVFFFQTSLIGFEARNFCYFPSKWKKVSSYIQLYHSSRQLHEETCPFAAMVGVAEPRRAHHLGSAEERTPGGHRFLKPRCLNMMCIYIYIYCIYYIYMRVYIYIYYIHMLIDLVYFNPRYTHIHRERYIGQTGRCAGPKSKIELE